MTSGGGVHRPPENNGAAVSGGEIPMSIVVMVGFLTALLIGCVTVLTVLNKPVDNLLVIVGAFIAPTVASLLAVRKLSSVDKKVNGTLSNLITDKAVLESQVNALGDIPATLPGHRRATDTRPRAFPKIGYEGDKKNGR